MPENIENRKKIIEETAISRCIATMLIEGIDNALALPQKYYQTRCEFWRNVYSKCYPYLKHLKPAIVEEMKNKHLQIEDEIKEKYEERKKQEGKS